jgi:RNA recognition motif-containing protein
MTANDASVHEENHAGTMHDEQATDGLNSSNGTFHNDGIHPISEQNETTKDDYDNNQQDKYDKNDLEAESLRKVFIGGLSYKTDDQVFREYFSKYGDIVVRK